MRVFIYKLIALIFLVTGCLSAQNLVVDGAISSNTNWNGQESPWSAGTYQNSYMAACGNNYVMEVDAASAPTQTLNGFTSSANYVLTFRYAYRSVGCGPSNNPTFLRIRFKDAMTVLDYTLSIANTVTTFAPFSYTFTNNAAATHTLEFTNLGNVNTCGVIVDDISIMKLASPGGIGSANISYWLKAESISLPDNSSVYGWMSQGANVVAVSKCANLPVYKTGLASAANNLVANFNPYLTFNGTDQYLEYTAANLNLVDNSITGAGQAFFSVYQGGSNTRTYFGHRGTTDSRTYGRTNRVVVANGAGNGTNNRINVAQTTRNNIVSVTGKTNGLTVSDRNGLNIAPSNNSTDADYLTVGVLRNTSAAYSEYFDGSLSEIILFNTILTNTQMHQVRSYLATKYGVTLTDNTSTAALDERTYLATDGTTAYWNYTVNTAYHNNVTVIGRDDATGLNQIRSISTDADAGSNTGNTMLDINNVSAFSSDKSFLAVGHNGTVIPNPGGADFSDVPATIQSRLKRVWKFQKTGTGVANNVNVRFDMTGFAPLTGSNLRLLVSNSPTFAGASIIAGAYAAPYFTASLPTTGGVYFTVASTNSVNTPLPVSLIEFTGSPENNDVALEWVTANEVNSDYFAIERSADASQFLEVGTVKAAGNSQARLTYHFLDQKPLSGINYYRLRKVDQNGAFEHTPTISVKSDQLSAQLSLYPNPGTGKFVLNIEGGERNAKIEVQVCDAQGAVVYDHKWIANTSNNTNYLIELSETVSKGVYFCIVSINGVKQTLKLVVE